MIDATKQPYFTLNSGFKIPALGLGTFQSEKGKLAEVIKKAILVDGYRHIDCARIYGNEEEIGQAFQECFAAGIKREDLFVTCKLWHSDKNDVEAAVNGSLARLQLDYLDLYLIHWMWPIVDFGTGTDEPKILSPPTHVVWKKMEEQVKKGKIRSIGVSNATAPVLIDLLAGCEIKPAVNQIEVHPYFQQTDLINLHSRFNIFVEGYASICRGSNDGIGKSEKEYNVLTDPVVVAIAQKHGKTPAQVCLNWAIQRKTIPLVKTTSLDRLTENFNCFSFELSSQDVEQINSLDAGVRLFKKLGFAPSYFN